MTIERLFKGVTILLFAFSFFSYFYVAEYRMGICQAQTVNDRTARNSLLIASQQSEYKDQLTEQLINRLMDQDIYIELIDISDLSQIDKNEYDAYVLLHTWEMYKAPTSITTFTKRVDNSKVFIVGTSGGGDLLLEGVDGISSASVLNTLDSDLRNIMNWLEVHLPK